MEFSKFIVTLAFIGNNGKCHNCQGYLIWENRGRTGRGAWEAHHKVAKRFYGSGTLENCAILCWPCHRATLG